MTNLTTKQKKAKPTTTVSACKIVGATPEYPCFCSCHPGKECMDCLCGRHKLKSTPTNPTTETVKCQFCGEPATKLRYKPDWFEGIAYDLCDSCADKHNMAFATPMNIMKTKVEPTVEKWVDIIREWHKEEAYPPVRPLAEKIAHSVQEAKAELADYCIHQDGCPLACWEQGRPRCACGLDDLLASLKQEEDSL